MGEVDNIFDQLDRARTSLDELEDRAVRAGELEGDVSKFLNVLENEAVKPAADTTVNLSLGAPTAAAISGISQSIVGAGAAAGRVRNLDDVLPQAEGLSDAILTVDAFGKTVNGIAPDDAPGFWDVFKFWDRGQSDVEADRLSNNFSFDFGGGENSTAGTGFVVGATQAAGSVFSDAVALGNDVAEFFF